ncbi:MAG TPA: hypothetical protein VN892_02015 [Solirubrobacteraceae bacterium]|nr:hypothetical protein [Solirubrobacteraceae bacterium]
MIEHPRYEPHVGVALKLSGSTQGVRLRQEEVRDERKRSNAARDEVRLLG